MGIKGLTRLIADNAPNAIKEQRLESYVGREVAIDASLSIYQFLIVIGRNGNQMLTNEAGDVTRLSSSGYPRGHLTINHLQGMFGRTIRLLEAGLKPVYVFDGRPPKLKKQELAKRHSKRAEAIEDLHEAIKADNKEEIEKFSKRTVRMTKQHTDDCKKLLRLMGVPVIEAPSEAEAQCAALCKFGLVYAVASEDMDSLTFGAPRFLRHLMYPSSKKIPVMEFEVLKVLDELNLTMDQFIDMCILTGCDYCASIRGIGGQTALKLIRQHGSIENILDNINKGRYQVPDDWTYQEARLFFKEPLVFSNDVQLDIEWRSPDKKELMNFLVSENGFNASRITKGIERITEANNMLTQGRFVAISKPVCNSGPTRQKESKCIMGSLKHTKPKMFSLHTIMHPGLNGTRSLSLSTPALRTRGYSCFSVFNSGLQGTTRKQLVLDHMPEILKTLT